MLPKSPTKLILKWLIYTRIKFGGCYNFKTGCAKQTHAQIAPMDILLKTLSNLHCNMTERFVQIIKNYNFWTSDYLNIHWPWYTYNA